MSDDELARQGRPLVVDDRPAVSTTWFADLARVRERAARERAPGVYSAVALGAGFVVLALGLATGETARWFLQGVVSSAGPTSASGPGAAAGASVHVLAVVTALTLSALYALAYRVEFVSVSGGAVPTQPVLVGMLLLLPLPLVPVAVLVGLLVGGIGSRESPTRVLRMLNRAMNGWHCVGPVVVLAVLAPGEPSWSVWPVYVAALAAQVVIDWGLALGRSYVHGVTPSQMVGPLRWTLAVDTLLGIIGVGLVVSASSDVVAVALLAAPVALVGLLAQDRSSQVSKAVEMSWELTNVLSEARTDAVTGLANRRAWDERLDIVRNLLANEPDSCLLVLMADLDGLKAVNDTMGHQAGDDMIVGMARVLGRTFPGAHTLARLGGDEFGVLLLGRRDELNPGAVVRRLREAVAAWPTPDGWSLSASLGVAACPPQPSPHDAVQEADARCYDDKRARRAGREQRETFRPGTPGRRSTDRLPGT